jgi:cysteine desulfurase / selenocysteine lyase
LNTPLSWEAFRRQMPITERFAYFDHSAVAPLPAPTRAAVELWLKEACEQGDFDWPAWAARSEATREHAAGLINAATEEIALIPNTTAGITYAAEGIDWHDGDNVVSLDNEFPSNVYPWMNLRSRGVELRRVAAGDGRIDLNHLADACDARTRVVALSWVGYSSGWRIDPAAAAALAHDHGALFFLDAIQGMGVFPLDVRAADIDLLAADGHKWMLGPEGAGIFYAKQSLLDQLRPLHVGWNSVRQRYDFDTIEFDLRQEAARYEGGSANMVGNHALGASLKLLREAGCGPRQSSVGERVLELAGHARDRLEQIGAVLDTPWETGHNSGIVRFHLPDQDSQQLRKKCLDQHVVVSYRGGTLRISPHAYNNEDDVERLIAALQSS